MELTSKNLTLRKLKKSDSECFFDVMGNERVMTPIPLNTLTRKESDVHLLELIKQEKTKVFAIIHQSDKSFIGICAIARDNEIIYRIRPQFWRLGYGSEATEVLIKYCFTVLNLKYLTAEANKSKVPSIKILERYFYKTGEYHDYDLNCRKYTYKQFNPVNG